MRGTRALPLLVCVLLAAAASAQAQAANQAKDQLHLPANSAHEATKSSQPEPDFVDVLQAEAERKGIQIDWGLDHAAQKAQEEDFKLNRLKSKAHPDRH